MDKVLSILTLTKVLILLVNITPVKVALFTYKLYNFSNAFHLSAVENNWEHF